MIPSQSSEIPFTCVAVSRGRSQYVSRLLGMMPTLNFCVPEAEAGKYTFAGVPPTQILAYPQEAPQTPGAQLNKCFDESPTGIVCVLPDTLTGVLSRVWRKGKRYKDAYTVGQVIQSMVNTVHDLDVLLGGWTHEPAASWSMSDLFTWNQPVRDAYVVQNLYFDDELHTRHELNATLCALHSKRVVPIDRRWRFETRVMPGDNSAQMNADGRQARRDEARVKRRWQRHVTFDGKGGLKTRVLVDRRTDEGFSG